MFNFFFLRLVSNPSTEPTQRKETYYNFGRARWPDIKQFVNTPRFRSDFFSCFDDKFPALCLDRFHSLIAGIVDRFVPRNSLPKFNYWWSPLRDAPSVIQFSYASRAFPEVRFSRTLTFQITNLFFLHL